MMVFNNVNKFLNRSAVATVLVASLGLGVSGSASAAETMQSLSGVDTLLTTIVTKSKVAGALEKDANGNLAMDANGNFKFNFTGNVFYPVTNSKTGQLMGTSGPIGTVSGQAAFPPAFAALAFGVYAALTTGAPMPVIPPKIDFEMNDLTVVVAGTTYRPIANPDMALDGRAFTGLGPVEIGTLLSGTKGLSMSVRTGGCLAMQAVSGTHAGKIGTQCLNGAFTFDLSGINLANPMASTLKGTATSNCTTVLHKPMQ